MGSKPVQVSREYFWLQSTNLSAKLSLVCGSAGSAKTVLGMEFLVHGIVEYDEPGVFMALEETEKDLSQNAASLWPDCN